MCSKRVLTLMTVYSHHVLTSHVVDWLYLHTAFIVICWQAFLYLLNTTQDYTGSIMLSLYWTFLSLVLLLHTSEEFDVSDGDLCILTKQMYKNSSAAFDAVFH